MNEHSARVRPPTSLGTLQSGWDSTNRTLYAPGSTISSATHAADPLHPSSTTPDDTQNDPSMHRLGSVQNLNEPYGPTGMRKQFRTWAGLDDLTVRRVPGLGALAQPREAGGELGARVVEAGHHEEELDRRAAQPKRKELVGEKRHAPLGRGPLLRP